jgi:arylsulfatase A-like enzyme
MPDSQVDKPNILFILADDLGWADVGYHGSPIRTPNIDRLAESGIEMHQHYVSPMCTPSRASLLTGRHPGRFGRHATRPTNAPVLPDGYETLATSFRNCGYETALFGKWHLGSSPRFAPNNFGFDTSYGSLAGGVDPYNHRYKKGEFSFTWHANGERIDERGHVTDLITDRAVNWVDSRSGPWLCYVPFTAVHIPVKAPQRWLDEYSQQSFDDDPEKDRSFRKYAAYTTQMDHAVGRLIEALEAGCRRENTIVVFSSDNGALWEHPPEKIDQYPGWQEPMPRLGSNLPLRGHKAQLYEGGIRTPTIISWRGTLKPFRLEHPVHIVDWMPTLTKLAGYTPEADPQFDGVDIWPLLIGEGGPSEERKMFWNFRGQDFCIREGDWKLIVRSPDADEQTELYNIGSDPYEKHDVAAENPHIVNRLKEKLDQERTLDDSSKRSDVDEALISRTDAATGV